MSRSNYHFIILILQILFINVLTRGYENGHTSSLLDTPEDRKNFYVVVIVATTMFAISCLGCLCVFYRTHKQWLFNNKEGLKMVHKLPFYTSVIDIFEDALFLVNILHTAIYASVFEEPACKTISMFLWAFDTVNLSLYVVIAVTSYLRICHEKFFCFGQYDYKLWLTTFMLSLIFQLINIYHHGARKYWCSGKSGQIVSSIILFCLILITLIIMLFCYINVLRVANRVLIESAKTEEKVAKKISRYILIFTLHWIPIVIQNFGRFLGVEHPWLYIAKSSGHAMGAIGNAVIYVINEGWTPQKPDNQFDEDTYQLHEY